MMVSVCPVARESRATIVQNPLESVTDISSFFVQRELCAAAGVFPKNGRAIASGGSGVENHERFYAAAKDLL